MHISEKIINTVLGLILLMTIAITQIGCGSSEQAGIDYTDPTTFAQELEVNATYSGETSLQDEAHQNVQLAFYYMSKCFRVLSAKRDQIESLKQDLEVHIYVDLSGGKPVEINLSSRRPDLYVMHSILDYLEYHGDRCTKELF